MDITTGWVSPNGTFHECKPTEHDRFAQEIFDVTETDLENRGFVKIFKHDNRLIALHPELPRYSYCGRKRLTQAQEEYLQRCGLMRT